MPRAGPDPTRPPSSWLVPSSPMLNGVKVWFEQRGWRWLPAPEPTNVEDFGLQGNPAPLIIGQGLILCLFAVPGLWANPRIPFWTLGVVWLCFAAYLTYSHRYLYPRATTSRARFYAFVFGNVSVGAAFALSLPVLAGTPQTALWVAFVAMAHVLGSSNAEGSVSLAAFHVLAPFATVPFFLNQGHEPTNALIGPLIASVAAGYAYLFTANRSAYWREKHRILEAELASRRLQDADQERIRLARNLHDSVGTALSMIALCAARAERTSKNLDDSIEVASTIREAARHALDDLRSLIAALPQSPVELNELCEGLHMTLGRAAESAGAKLEIAVTAGGAQQIQGPVRTNVVRVFQEAVHNALRHGRATAIEARFSATAQVLEISLSDNGSGFDVNANTAGTGLAGIRDRLRELGGQVQIDSAPHHGTRIDMRVPLKELGGRGLALALD